MKYTNPLNQMDGNASHDDATDIELDKLLNHLFTTGGNIPEVFRRELTGKERPKATRKTGRIAVGPDGEKILIIDDTI